jgi:hypothetical protein
MPTRQYNLTKAMDSRRKFGPDKIGNPNYGQEAVNFFSNEKINKLTRSWPVGLEGLFWIRNKVWYSFFLWTLGLAFGGFTLWPFKSRGHGSSWPKLWTLGFAFGNFTMCLTKDSNSYVLLTISSPFLWTLNKVWPFNPTASRLGRPINNVWPSLQMYMQLEQCDVCVVCEQRFVGPHPPTRAAKHFKIPS